MFTLFGLGFLIGMRHAFEADHAAAVATLATRNHSIGHAIRQGVVWGFGHTLTLLLCSSIIFSLESTIPERFAQGLEFLVGCMLVGLGIDVVRRLIKERIHFHVHQHRDQIHFHAHSHQGESKNHQSSAHQHIHPQGFPYRALLIGFMHGMAGSAALIILTLQTTLSPLTGLIYIVIFGLGSIAGMAALSLIIALPLRYSAHSFTWAHNGLQGCVGVITIIIGATILLNTGTLLLN